MIKIKLDERNSSEVGHMFVFLGTYNLPKSS